MKAKRIFKKKFYYIFFSFIKAHETKNNKNANARIVYKE